MLSKGLWFAAAGLALIAAMATACVDDDDDDAAESAVDDDGSDDDIADDDADDDVDDDADDDADDDVDDDADDDTSSPETLKAMSFNLRTGLAFDGADAWWHRNHIVSDFITSEMPDVMGVQEALIFQLQYIQREAPGYDWVGRSRTHPLDEYSAVFYRTDRYELIASDTFWLSDTPDVVGSEFTSNQLCPRIVTWAELESLATGRTFFVFNTHFDTYHGEEVHERSAALLAERIADVASDAPVLVTGDFNESVGSNGYLILTGGMTFSDVTGDLVDPWVTLGLPEEGTFHGFTGEPTGDTRIDWVLTSDDFAPESAEVSHYNEDGRYPSDHFPVLATLTLGVSTK